MATAKGKLKKNEDSYAAHSLGMANYGNTVTIELQKGMKVIGPCSTCQEELKPFAHELTCVLRHGFEYEPTKFGCRDWKPRRGCRRNERKILG